MASTNRCTYCGKEFAKARTLQVHLCEPKRRYLQKDEKWVVNAFMVFQRFYQIHQHNSKPKTYDEFVKSAYYNAFVKFGRFIMHINPLYPDKYINFVLRSKIKLDHWARDDLYETYLIEALKTEPVEAALQRSITNNDGLGYRTKRTMVRLLQTCQHKPSSATHTARKDKSVVIVRLQCRKKDVKLF